MGLSPINYFDLQIRYNFGISYFALKQSQKLYQIHLKKVPKNTNCSVAKGLNIAALMTNKTISIKTILIKFEVFPIT